MVSTLHVDAVVRRGGFELAIRLDAAGGETIGVLGGVGSGKSTLLALIAGLVPATEGRVRYDDVAWDDPGAGIRVAPKDRCVSHLVQRPTLIDDVPAIDQVAAASSTHRLDNGSAAAARQAACDLLDELAVPAAVYERDGWTLSGGETQCICLARTFAAATPIVLLDDPYGSLDSRSAKRVRTWLTDRLAARSHLTIVACSDPQDTLHLADRLVDLG